MPRGKDRRRAQAGTTLIELLVSLVIIGLALMLVVGTFSTGLLNATLAKRNTAVQAAMHYELARISGSQFDNSAQFYSECFATESSIAPILLANYQDPCPGGQPYTLRADVSWTPKSASSQLWTVAVTVWPSGALLGSTISTYKVNR
jgi:prepilin-type N-terminal cleavage/methylation domain-containing protein